MISDTKEPINSLNLNGFWTQPNGRRKKKNQEKGYKSSHAMESNPQVCREGGRKDKEDGQGDTE